MSATVSFQGIGASPGVAVGRAFIVDAQRVRTPKVKLRREEIDEELRRFHAAVALSCTQLDGLKGLLTEYGSEGREHELILEAHRLMLQDPLLLTEVTRLVREEAINAEWAVRRVCRRLRHQFDNLDDEYFSERRSDIEFVAHRLVRNLMGQTVDRKLSLPPHSVIVARDVAPAEVLQLFRDDRAVAIVTDLGGQTSHTAILARAHEVPAVVGLSKASQSIRTGDMLAVDGRQGFVLVNPSEAQLESFQETIRQQEAIEKRTLQTAELPAVTTDGYRVRLYGNMERQQEIPSLLAHGAEGIGLYRSEFLFFGRSTLPTEGEHFESYKNVLTMMQGRPVTIRTLDLGGDKVPGKKPEKETNPAMGMRAIRYCLKHTDLFYTQLRALLRASAYGDLRIMFPLISSVSELREARSALEYCRSELSRQGVPMRKRLPVGIMVETPSAALIADRLAQEADFFSIGTNDLIQYTIAIDRHNRDVARLYRPLHLAVLRSLSHIATAAKKAGIPVAMCGEMAGDPTLTTVLLAMGIQEFSMTARQIPAVKHMVRTLSQADASALLEKAMQFSSAEEIERLVRESRSETVA